MTTHVAIIGLGAIGLEVAQIVSAVPSVELVAVLVRGDKREMATRLGPSVVVSDRLDDVLAARPDLVVEAAGQAAVTEAAVRVLDAGCDLMVASTGAFADDDLLAAVIAAAERGSARVVVPTGAIAGLDGLVALRTGGLHRVTYTSTKPAAAWRGTCAEEMFDLDALAAPRVLFDGTARDAARSYPRNANVAMTVALAGLGPDRTLVRLVADPAATVITGSIDAEGTEGRLRVSVSGRASATNPRTSATTAHSLAAAVVNRSARIAIGSI